MFPTVPATTDTVTTTTSACISAYNLNAKVELLCCCLVRWPSVSSWQFNRSMWLTLRTGTSLVSFSGSKGEYNVSILFSYIFLVVSTSRISIYN